jgi:hypothetical protein
MRATSLIAALLLCAAPALAVDGVREINQTCAESTGCFLGDTAGFPVTITAPGSYRLTGNLTLTDADTDAIVVTGNDADIDLNGFAITGITVCNASCTNTGTGRGIATPSFAVRGVSVHGGTVSQMGETGVALGRQARVEDVRAISNGGWGIIVSAGSQVLRCVVARNGTGGIVGGGLIADNTVSFTLGTEPGISGDGVVRGNHVSSGAAAGIAVGNGSLVSGNTVSANVGDGIQGNDGTRMIGNTLYLNSGFGILFGGPGGYSDNTILESVAGVKTVSGPGVNLGGNQCNGVATCP